MSKNQIKSITESILLVSDDPVTLDKLCALIEEAQRQEIKEALDALKTEYETDSRGIILVEVAGGYQLRTSPASAPWILRMEKIRPVKLSRAAIETLSIIAYRQPITKQEVEAIRGVDSGWTIRTLLEKNLVKIIGKKEEPGSPLLYSTTKEFLEFFNLKGLDDLPTLKEYGELAQQQAANPEEPELKFRNEE